MQVSVRFFALASGLCLLLVAGIWFWPAPTDPALPDSQPGREPVEGVELPPEWEGLSSAPEGGDVPGAGPRGSANTAPERRPGRPQGGSPAVETAPRPSFDLITQGFTVLDAAADFVEARGGNQNWRLEVLAGKEERAEEDERKRRRREETRKQLAQALTPITRHLMFRPSAGMDYLAMLDAAPVDQAFAAAVPLRYARSPELVAELVRRLTQAPDPNARLFAIQALKGREDVAAARAVQAATVDPTPVVRAAAQLAVGGFLNDSALRSLRPGLLAAVRTGLSDPDPLVRREAILALNGLAPQADLQPLLEDLAADQAEPTVAALAAHLLRFWAEKAE